MLPTAIRELARNFQDDADIIGFLKERAIGDENSHVRSLSLQELAGNFPHHTDTIGLLQHRAIVDEDANVCRIALEELAQNFHIAFDATKLPECCN
ncbi:hypothetical protein NIES22_22100 [Calothrix brevissima NIES-22]|nr:hypothetical protein NIES22_22100 [Calothrix brevissima NIES-22]